MHNYIHEHEAFVLKKRSLLETDVLVTLFTKEKGKIICVAKGSRRLTSRRLPHLQTGNYIVAHIREQMGGRQYLQTTTLKSLCMKVKENKESQLAYISGLYYIDCILPEGVEEAYIFQKLIEFVQILDRDPDNAQNHLTSFLNEVMIKFGYIQHRYSLSQLRIEIEDLIGRKLPRFTL